MRCAGTVATRFLPLLIYFFLGCRQLKAVMSFQEWGSSAFLVCFTLAAVMGVVLQYSTYLCTQVWSDCKHLKS